ncbi:aldo/keto reductase [Novosphingobium sp. SL115]|uniref:aldo/keto reductase n=1 Tax=Novosphingobium sp. SL115 TaxID=2995150 RepID=UPI0022725676|nr:aldo/keto reductase [Novosphingobium sp. SL115]MCY1672001.1 aldo/keto reductase [Novosphingobium sp. SL115]
MSTLPEIPLSRSLGSPLLGDEAGLTISSIGWGMWRLVEARLSAGEIDALVNGVLDAGITLFDTADIYGFNGAGGFGDAETLLGTALGANRALRSRMVLATKGGICPPLPYDQSASYIAQAIDASLKRLNTDRIDLWQLHRPDVLTHPQELARALDDAVAAGKIRTLGVSNFTVPQIDALQHFLGQKLVSTQPEISALRLDCFENGEMDHAMMRGLSVLAWSPLGGGRIATPVSPREHAVAAALDACASEQGISRTLAALSWLMAHPAGIVPIVGSQNPARIAEAAGASAVRWTRAAWYAVYVASRGVPLP